VIIFLLITK